MPFNLSAFAAVSTRVETAVSFPYTPLTGNDRNVLDEYASDGIDVGPLTQTTPRTCGAMVGVVAALVRDGFTIEQLCGISATPDIKRAELDTYERMHERHYWPQRWGTTPWALAEELSQPGQPYLSLPVSDETETGWNTLQWAFHAAAAGKPSALYTGDSIGYGRHGIRGAVPRHVIGVLPGENYTPNGLPQLTIYEPSAGKIFHMPLHTMMAREKPHPAFGQWTHVVWAVLPGQENK